MTIKDLALKTGYSVGTISRVLNNQPNVSQRARNAILEAVEESGFQLNSNAKQLKQHRSTSVLVEVSVASTALSGSLVEAIQSRLVRTEYPVIVDYLDEDDDEVLRAGQLCREKKPRGILFLGGNRVNFERSFQQIHVPCVLVTSDAQGLHFSNLSSVTSDDRLGAYMAIDHLVDLGHRNIAVIGGDRSVSDTSRLRYEGCLDAFSRHNLAFDPDRDYRGGRFSFEEGYRAARSLLEEGRPYTAIFAAADVMAIGAIRALRDSGLRVPEDVSVMGYDGLRLGEYYVPKLATIAQNVEMLAHRSVDILRSCMENNGVARHEIVPITVICKESAQPVER